jgi:phosphohistidine phosphatase
MRLYLVRHGVAVDRNDPDSPKDTERPLTPKGMKRTQAAALGLVALDVKPEVVLTSPWLRAVQTAEILCEVLGFSENKIIRMDALKGTSNPTDLFRELAKLKAKDVICVGHEPHLHQTIGLVVHSSGPITELKKAGVACLELERISPPQGKLLALYPAKTLRLLGKC